VSASGAVLALAVLAATGGPAHAAPPPGRLAPPAGWKAVSKPLRGVVPGTQYVAPVTVDGFTANFSVVEAHVPYAIELARLRRGSPGVRWQILDDRPSACTGGSARMIGYAYRYAGRELEGLALVASRAHVARTFVVTYTRLRRSPPDPAAIRALERYCSQAGASASAAAAVAVAAKRSTS